MICETPESESPVQDQICPERIDFGIIYIDQPSFLSVNCLPGTIFESDLTSIIYFDELQQEITAKGASVNIYFRPNRIGI